MTAKADGTKLNPFIVFLEAKRETKQLNEEFKNKCYVASSVNEWVNEDLTHDWEYWASPHLLIGCWLGTIFKCHIIDSIKQEHAHAKINPVIVPGGCTT